MTTDLFFPIDAVMPALVQSLADFPNLLLQAEPGAGKTTRFPIALLNAPWRDGKRVLMLEPRRMAARMAAGYMAQSLGERPGHTVGYTIRDERVVSPYTQIEVITEGVLSRYLQQDPCLEGVAAILFDEHHERSVHSDVGLALSLELQQILRPELRLVVMSATLEAGLQDYLHFNQQPAPIINVPGRHFPIQTHWMPHLRPPDHKKSYLASLKHLIVQALDEQKGDLLVFLPGMREITLLAQMLQPEASSQALLICPLHSQLPPSDQDRAIKPDPQGRRKIVLSTNLAQTSLTIAGITTVVDSGFTRSKRYDPATGFDIWETNIISRAAAHQRGGRAGRLGPGVCYRLWSKVEEGAMIAHDPPEILSVDLAPLVLDLALWGHQDAANLRFLTPPPESAFAAGRDLLQRLGALDMAGKVTDFGKAVSRLPMHPRFAAQILRAKDRGQGWPACLLAALLSEGGLPVNQDVMSFLTKGVFPQTITQLAHKWAVMVSVKPDKMMAFDMHLVVSCLMDAFPDRIAQKRKNEPAKKGVDSRYLTAVGQGLRAVLDVPFLLALHIQAAVPESRAIQVIPLAGEWVLNHPDAVWYDQLEWDEEAKRVIGRRQRRLGALVLDSVKWDDPPPQQVCQILVDVLHRQGMNVLPWSQGAQNLRLRINWARSHAPQTLLPEFSDQQLVNLVIPLLQGRDDFDGLDIEQIMWNALDWQQQQWLNQKAPAFFTTPSGYQAAIDYGQDIPTLAARVQDFFGMTSHPKLQGVALRVVLLTPADRPAQITLDIPGFWRGSYADLKKDLFSRYPKHAWPDKPEQAMAMPRKPARSSRPYDK